MEPNHTKIKQATLSRVHSSKQSTERNRADYHKEVKDEDKEKKDPIHAPGDFFEEFVQRAKHFLCMHSK